jgi:hypothetical protein
VFDSIYFAVDHIFLVFFLTVLFLMSFIMYPATGHTSRTLSGAFARTQLVTCF